jgi:hypothetical protein
MRGLRLSARDWRNHSQSDFNRPRSRSVIHQKRNVLIRLLAPSPVRDHWNRGSDQRGQRKPFPFLSRTFSFSGMNSTYTIQIQDGECRRSDGDFFCALRCVASQQAKTGLLPQHAKITRVGSPGLLGAAAREPAAQGTKFIFPLPSTCPFSARCAPRAVLGYALVAPNGASVS